MIHYCISPYVTSIKALDDSFEIESLSLCGNTLCTKLKSSDIIHVHNQPFANWGIKGSSITIHPWNFPVRRRLKFYVHSNLEDLSGEMKLLIDKIEMSGHNSSFINSPDTEWDAKIVQLKKKS